MPRALRRVPLAAQLHRRGGRGHRPAGRRAAGGERERRRVGTHLREAAAAAAGGGGGAGAHGYLQGARGRTRLPLEQGRRADAAGGRECARRLRARGPRAVRRAPPHRMHGAVGEEPARLHRLHRAVPGLDLPHRVPQLHARPRGAADPHAHLHAVQPVPARRQPPHHRALLRPPHRAVSRAARRNPQPLGCRGDESGAEPVEIGGRL
mmetsp:Transcript_38099/g.94706  ORF Transcript_38099/g.94706 Transcript_38099/m.94706 type:complete len:208 (+) Transcript_38099:643-1266(+)